MPMSERSFPFYRYFPADMAGSGKVQMMNATAFGIYQALLNCSWQEGPLPDDPALLWRPSKADSLEEFERYWPLVRKCWDETPDGLVNKRMEKERARATDRSDKAKESARSRWGNANADANGHADGHANGHANADATAMLEGMRSGCSGDANSEAQNSESQIPETQALSNARDARSHADGFRELWDARPSGPLVTAEGAYWRVIDGGADPGVVRTRWLAYVARQERDGLRVANMANWLRSGGYADASLDRQEKSMAELLEGTD